MWLNKYRNINKSISGGQLTQACRDARRADLTRTVFGRRIATKLVNRLVNRANRQTVAGDLSAAWNDLSDAASIATGTVSDQVSKQTNRLVDTTIEHANLYLTNGKIAQANRTIGLLKSRKILDGRADRIGQICEQINAAEQMAASGKMNQAKSKLEEIKREHSNLDFLDFKIRSYETQQNRLASLTGKLRSAINESAWGGARDVTNQMLNIAPQYQIAVDAERRCESKEKTKKRLRNPEAHPPRTGDLDNADGIQIISVKNVGARDTERPVGQDTEKGKPKSASILPQDNASSQDHHDSSMDNFMLWIDGVGGFLICTKPEIMIGQAVPDSGVDVPVQADIRRRHLRIRRVDNGLIAEPIGSVKRAGKILAESIILYDRQSLDLGAGVTLQIEKTNPLGNTCRLEFTSRHRTEPWSDAVILMGDAIILGPDRNSHICCPQWKQDIVIFRQGDQLFLRCGETVEINGQTCSGDIALEPNIRISGDDFSISFESS